MCSLELHARVDRLVQEIGGEVHHHGVHRDLDGHRLDHRKVAALYGEDHLAPDAGDREEALDEEGAGEQPRQLKQDMGDDRNRRVAQDVHPHHAVLAQALGAGGAHVVLVDLVEKEAAVQAYVRGKRNRDADDDRQHAVAQQVLGEADAPALHREPAELVGEHILEHQDVHQDADRDRKSTRLNSSHLVISYAVFCLKKKNKNKKDTASHHVFQ